MTHGTYYWDDDKEKMALSDFTFEVQPGQFTCVSLSLSLARFASG